MARVLLSMPLILLLTASVGSSAPVDGAYSKFGVRIEANSQKDFGVTFQAGRRACVIAVANRQPPVDVGIVVYDDANQLISEDQGVGFAAAIWYPPREAKCRVVVKNFGKEYNEMYLVFK